MKLMTDIDLANQRVLMREDLNVPMQNGVIVDDSRLKASLPSILAALQQGPAVILMSHLGRPVEGDSSERFSLAPIAHRLSELLDKDILFAKDWAKVPSAPGSVTLLENVRFNKGELKNHPSLAKAYADLCDVFVMDAFASAHRAQASTHGVARYASIACAGPLLHSELTALERALIAAKKPMIAVIGGSKISSKLEVLNEVSRRCDRLIVGGGIANTFLAAAGYPIGRSLCEWHLLDVARRLMDRVTIPLPIDVVVAPSKNEGDQATVKLAADVLEHDMILDVGPKTSHQVADQIKKAKTIVWNGPLGVFEEKAFAQGTCSLASSIRDSSAFSLAGGGDTLSAINQFGVAESISYISTGGGAFLEYIEGKLLPAVAILEERALD